MRKLSNELDVRLKLTTGAKTVDEYIGEDVDLLNDPEDPNDYDDDEWPEEPDIDLDHICDCGLPADDCCGFCGKPLCHMCYECGAGFCSGPHTDQQVAEYARRLRS